MAGIVLSLLILLASPSIAFAESTATVKVNTSVNSSTGNQSNVKTNIRVETNGNVTTYSSDKAEDIEVKAEDDKSEIKVDGKVVTGNNNESESTPTPTPKPTREPEEKENEDKDKGFFEILKEKFSFLSSIFSIFD